MSFSSLPSHRHQMRHHSNGQPNSARLLRPPPPFRDHPPSLLSLDLHNPLQPRGPPPPINRPFNSSHNYQSTKVDYTRIKLECDSDDLATENTVLQNPTFGGPPVLRFPHSENFFFTGTPTVVTGWPPAWGVNVGAFLQANSTV